jgi:hypothetical protein
MTRSWTLQEGILPPDLLILLQNDMIAFERVPRITTLGPYAEGSIYECLDDTAQSACTCINVKLQNSFRNTFFGESPDFVTLWNQLAGRSTTKKQDIPIMLTTLLNLENILASDYTEPVATYQSVLLSLEQIPLSLFFNNGFRLYQHDNPLLDGSQLKLGLIFLRPRI